MDLNKIIAPHKIADITKIYYGLDHCCRCGCGGSYHEVGERGFKMKLTRITKTTPLKVGTKMYTRDGRVLDCEGISKGSNYVNIPVDGDNDKCFCVYFD